MTPDELRAPTRYKTVRIRAETLAILRFLHAATGESIIALIDRLAREEWSKRQPTVMRSNG